MIEKINKSQYEIVARLLSDRIDESAPTRLQLLVGPRQVGKTTLLLDLHRKHSGRSIYATADAPEAALPTWADGIWRQAESLATDGPAILFLDEVHFLPDWSRWLKARYDEVLRKRLPLHVVITGSSSLNVGAGSRETMAGRFERLQLTHWSAGALNRLLGVPEQQAPERIVTHGGYPGAVALWDDPGRWRAYLRDAIVEPAIGRDILHLEQVRKPALLRQVFALATAHPAEILSLEKMAGLLSEKCALETISHYLQLLQEAFLVAPIQKYAGSEIRRRRSPPKLVVLNNALIAGSRTEPPPAQETDPTAWCRWVENACLAHLWNSGHEIHYWRKEPWEVDAVSVGPGGKWLIEIKTGEYHAHDLRGLAEATQEFPGFTPIVLCDPGHEEIARTAGFVAKSWRDFLLDDIG